MSALIARGNWNIAKGKLKQLLARLTDDDLGFVEGKADELVGRIQKRAGIRRKRVDQRTEHYADEDRRHHGHR